MINKIHEWALGLILNDHTSDFGTLLQSLNDTCNHHRNIETLIVVIYKIKNKLNPPISDFLFERGNNMYNLGDKIFMSLRRKEKEL